MNHRFCMQLAAGGAYGGTGRTAAGCEPDPLALEFDLRAARPMDGAVDTTPARECRIRSVDDRIDFLQRDVAAKEDKLRKC